MSIQNELTKLYKKLSEEGLNKEAQRLTPFIKESQFFTFLKPKHNRALRQINRDIKDGNTVSAEAQLDILGIDLITDKTLMADLKKNLKQGDASGRRKFMRMLKAILKVLKAGGNVTLQTVKQEVETDAPAEEVKKDDSKEDKTNTNLPQIKNENETEIEESKGAKSTTELKAVPTSEEGAIGDKNYKYFYNPDKKGFQVAKESNTSVGAIIRPENKAAGKTDVYNERLNKAYAIIFKMFKDQDYDMREIPSPQAKAEYTGPASDVRYEEWKPESVGLDPQNQTDEEVSGIKYKYYTLAQGTDKGNLPDYGTSIQQPLIFVKEDDISNSKKKKIKNYYYGTAVTSNNTVNTELKPAEVTITPAADPKDPPTYAWKKKE